jgi:hypothetical protein
VNVNVIRALDEHVEAELAEARVEAERLMDEVVAAYQRVTELELARDLRRTLGAKVAIQERAASSAVSPSNSIIAIREI